jgi:hypothetical protein
MDDQAERMQEDSPPSKRDDSQLQEQIANVLDAELGYVINDHATAELLSSQCQEALAAAFSHDVVAPTLRALVRAGKDTLASTAIPQFWNSISTWEPEDHSQLVAALKDLVAVAQALHQKVTCAVDFLKSQAAEHTKARVILLWAAPRVFFLDEGELIYQSKDIKSSAEDTVDFPSTFLNFSRNFLLLTIYYFTY